MENQEQSRFKILVFPWLAHGHIFPLLELSKRLSRRRFHIHFCSTAVNLVSIETSIRNDDVAIELVELPMPSSSQLPPEFHTTKNLPTDLLFTLMKTFQSSSSSFADIVRSVNPDLIIYDLFQPWAAKIALSKGIPAVFFAASGAAAYAFYYHLHKEGTSSTFPFQAIYLKEHEMINRARLQSTVKDTGEGFAFGCFDMSQDVVLMKSCRGIEGKYIDYLSESCKKKVIPTGPLIVDSNDYEDDDKLLQIMEWLNGKEDCSTVYISFGSEYFLSVEQIGEIGKGLELCKENFIWVVRFPVQEKGMTVEEALPEGFLDRVGSRGMVVQGWAPQAKILAHRSIGGFMSHCGWSSVVESMYFGVPIIAVPMKSEQPINGRLAVEAGVGVEVTKGGEGWFTGDKVAEAISKVISDTTFGEGLRRRAKRLSEKIKEKEEEEENDVAEGLWRICMNNE